jgi:hypothetical protein
LTFLLLLTLFFLAVPFGRHLVIAQQQDYKAGDIVEVKWIDKWVKAKVDKCLNANLCVVYFYDVWSGKYETGPEDISTDHMRATVNTPPTKSDTSKQGNDEAATATTSQVTAQKPAVACPASDDLKGDSQPAIFKRLIAGRYLKDGKGVPTTIQFQTFKTGVTHKWRPGVGGESPDGPGGYAGATIYPAKATYTVCEDYPGYKPTGYRGQLLKVDYDNTFYCFKNETGDWQCNLGPGKQSKPQDTPK